MLGLRTRISDSEIFSIFGVNLAKERCIVIEGKTGRPSDHHARLSILLFMQYNDAATPATVNIPTTMSIYVDSFWTYTIYRLDAFPTNPIASDLFCCNVSKLTQ